MPNHRKRIKKAYLEKQWWITPRSICILLGYKNYRAIWDAFDYEIRHFGFVEDVDYFIEKFGKVINRRSREYWFSEASILFTMHKLNRKNRIACISILRSLIKMKGGRL